MEKFLATWVLDRNEKFDEYLKARDVPWLIRKAIVNMSYTKIYKRVDDDTFEVTSKSSMKTVTWKFKLGVVFEEESHDNTIHEIKFELDVDGNLIETHVHKKDGLVEVYKFYIEGDTFVCTSEFNGVIMKRYFKKQH